MQNLQTISTKELRDNLAEILEKVAIGKESFLVSKFGKEKALITPTASKGLIQKKQKRNLKNLLFYGIWKDREDMKGSTAWVSKMRRRQSFRIRKEEENEPIPNR